MPMSKCLDKRMIAARRDEVLAWTRRKRRRRVLMAIVLGSGAIVGGIWWDRPSERPSVQPEARQGVEVELVAERPPRARRVTRPEVRGCPDGGYWAPSEVLVWDDDLDDVAMDQAAFLADMGYFAHRTPENGHGVTLSERLRHLDAVENSGEALYRGSEDGARDGVVASVVTSLSHSNGPQHVSTGSRCSR